MRENIVAVPIGVPSGASTCVTDPESFVLCRFVQRDALGRPECRAFRQTLVYELGTGPRRLEKCLASELQGDG
jgi:hypothetical protein